MVSAVVTEVGGAIGGAIAGTIWAALMSDKLAQYLPFLDDATRKQLSGPIAAAAACPRGHPAREAVILAYDDVMKILTIVATVFTVVPRLLPLLVPNWYLGDQQNAANNLNLAGKRVHKSDIDTNQSTPENS